MGGGGFPRIPLVALPIKIHSHIIASTVQRGVRWFFNFMYLELQVFTVLAATNIVIVSFTLFAAL